MMRKTFNKHFPLVVITACLILALGAANAYAQSDDSRSGYTASGGRSGYTASGGRCEPTAIASADESGWESGGFMASLVDLLSSLFG